MVIYLSLLVAIIGALMFALASNPKLVELGKIFVLSGSLAFLLRVTDINILPK